MSRQNADHGFWPSPISAGWVASQASRIREISCLENAAAQVAVAWVEQRSDLQGRCIIKLQDFAGQQHAVLDAEHYSARSLLNSYGGGAIVLGPQALFFVNHDPHDRQQDQRIFMIPLAADLQPQGPPVALTEPAACCYGGLSYDAAHRRVIAVREMHWPDGRCKQSVVAISAGETAPGREDVLAEGYDFFADPVIDSSGSELACVAWNQPNMPWDNTELLLVKLNERGEARKGMRLNSPCKGPVSRGESIQQPRWDREDRLYCISDRDNWWRPYRYDRDADCLRPCVAEYPPHLQDWEFAGPGWELGAHSYGFSLDNRLFALAVRQGSWILLRIDEDGGQLTELELVLPDGRRAEHLARLQLSGMSGLLVAASATLAPQLLQLDVASSDGQCASIRTVASVADTAPFNIELSEPRSIRFPVDGAEAFALFYPPVRPSTGDDGDDKARPPLLIKTHGGPTSACTRQLDWSIQFFTSRGFAVVDIDYRGSTGYGRVYRHALYGEWGQADLADCLACIDFLAARGEIDSERVFARGQSAGGYLTLMLACFSDRLRAGASTAGISDLGLLYQHTHRFEQEYLRSLLYCTPADDEGGIYQVRSPVNAPSPGTPLLFVQGSDDRVVPKEQTFKILQRLQDEGIDAELLLFPGEQHGLRQQDNIARALEAELEFFQRYL